MNTGIVAMRYAKALFAYAKEQGAEDAIYKNMLQLMAALQQVKELDSVLNAPTISSEERVALLCAAVDAPFPVYKTFMQLVVNEEREQLLIFIAHCYLTLYRKAKNILAVKFTTAQPVDEALCDKVSAVAAGEGAIVEMQNIIDADIIGGFVFETETHRLDASVKRQLRDIETVLVKQNRKLV